MIKQDRRSAAATARYSERSINPACNQSGKRIRKGSEGLTRTSARIPPHISLKTGCRKSPNTGKLQFHTVENSNAFVHIPALSRSRKGTEDLTRTSASIPLRISLKTGPRKSPNTGELHFTPDERRSFSCPLRPSALRRANLVLCRLTAPC